MPCTARANAVNRHDCSGVNGTALADIGAIFAGIVGHGGNQLEQARGIPAVQRAALQQVQFAVGKGDDDAAVVGAAAETQAVAELRQSPGIGGQVDVARLRAVGTRGAAQLVVQTKRGLIEVRLGDNRLAKGAPQGSPVSISIVSDMSISFRHHLFPSSGTAPTVPHGITASLPDSPGAGRMKEPADLANCDAHHKPCGLGG